MTQDTPSPESSGSGTNWTMIAIIAGIVVVVILVIFGFMNRSGNGSDSGEISTPAPPATAARLSIVEPSNGTVVDISAPITVRGTGEGLPEGNVVVEALDAAGNVLATQPTTIVASDAGAGGSGPWSVELTVAIPPGTTGSVRAYSPSPADGSVMADVSVGVTYGEASPPAEASITIEIPLTGEIVSAEEVVVVGQGTALPENNVVVRVIDDNGVVLAEQPTTVDAELGGTGEWRATLRYTVAPGMTGQINAFAPSPADGSVVAQASVNVQYGTAAAAQPAITIAAPQQGEVVNPAQITVSGIGAALPENNVVVRALDANGAVLAEQATIVDAELGGTGPWSVALDVDVPGGTPGRIDASSASPDDNSIVAQAAVDVVYGAPAAAEPLIIINIPITDEVISAEEVVAVGQGTALPENNVVVRVIDDNGNILAEEVTTVAADLGGTGEWRATLRYTVEPGMVGQIYAFSTSPADGSIVAQASVNVTFGRGRD